MKEAARAAGIPVFSIKSAGVGDVVKALRTLVGIDPSPGGLFADGDDYVTGAARVRGSWAGLGGCYSMVRAAQQTALLWRGLRAAGAQCSLAEGAVANVRFLYYVRPCSPRSAVASTQRPLPCCRCRSRPTVQGVQLTQFHAGGQHCACG